MFFYVTFFWHKVKQKLNEFKSLLWAADSSPLQVRVMVMYLLTSDPHPAVPPPRKNSCGCPDRDYRERALVKIVFFTTGLLRPRAWLSTVACGMRAPDTRRLAAGGALARQSEMRRFAVQTAARPRGAAAERSRWPTGARRLLSAGKPQTLRVCPIFISSSFCIFFFGTMRARCARAGL